MPGPSWDAELLQDQARAQDRCSFGSRQVAAQAGTLAAVPSALGTEPTLGKGLFPHHSYKVVSQEWVLSTLDSSTPLRHGKTPHLPEAWRTQAGKVHRGLRHGARAE